MEELIQIRLLGVRGTVPVSDPGRFGKFGCATMCVWVQMAGETILLDAGTGLLNAMEPEVSLPSCFTLLLSHPHADHLLGLPVWPHLFSRDTHINVWSESRCGLEPVEQVRALMSPPLWPVAPEDLPAEINWRLLPQESITAGEVRIEHMEAKHPGGVTAFRLSAGGRSVVYATDCELDEPTREKLIPFARDCDLLLCDGQYSDEEYLERVGWGHSSVSMALAFSAQCGAKRTVLIHHAPFRTDTELDAADEKIQRTRPDCSLGRQGGLFVL